MQMANQPRFDELFRDFRPATPLERVTRAQDVPRSRKANPRSSKRAESDMKRTGTIRWPGADNPGVGEAVARTEQ
jgi:hypothetical protein